MFYTFTAQIPAVSTEVCISVVDEFLSKVKPLKFVHLFTGSGPNETQQQSDYYRTIATCALHQWEHRFKRITPTVERGVWSYATIRYSACVFKRF